jgi:radical SAM superfamily enzyme YgiQ (UPF0313 family)
MQSANHTYPMVCLVRPPGVETFRIGTSTLVPPLGLAYIAAAVGASGCRVHVIDAVTEAPKTHTRYFRGYLVGLPLPEVVARVPAEASAVGITCMFTHEWPMVVHLIELLKERRPDLLVVVGGEHVTATPEFSLATSRADVLVLGEGEETAAELFAALASGAPLDGVDGIAFRRDGEIVVNRRRARRVSIDDIPRPAWHLFDLNAYHDHRFVGGVYSSQLTVPMLATRGCPYQCTYCSSPNMWTTRWIARDPKAVADEMEDYVQQYGAGNFPFYDLTAVIQKNWIVAFCREIIDRGLDVTWQLASGTRSEAIDGEVAELLKRSGMINMAYAPESGSDLTRRYIKKKMHNARLFKSIEFAAKADLSVAAYMVIGFPHDGPNELRETVNFLREIAKRGVNDVGSGYYMALPGTELFRTLYEKGAITIDRTYFCHILSQHSFIPTASYSDQLGRLGLFYWKVRCVVAFYLSRVRVMGIQGVLLFIAQTLSGRTQSAKLQTGLRVALRSGLGSVKMLLVGSRWMPREQERRLFEPWDRTYREISERRREAGIESAPPLDSRELENQNFVRALRLDHDVPRGLRLRHELGVP